MKKSIFLGFLIASTGLMLTTHSVHAQMGMMDYGYDQNGSSSSKSSDSDHTSSVETVLQQILQSQNVSTVEQLNLSKVTDDQWESLGDAVMEMYHPGQAHEVMDQMMGGEGSASLRAMHINMGKNYLGYGSNYGMMGNWSGTNNSQGGYPMMGYGPMMGGWWGGYGVSGVLSNLTWLAAIVFLTAGAYYFIKKARSK